MMPRMTIPKERFRNHVNVVTHNTMCNIPKADLAKTLSNFMHCTIIQGTAKEMQYRIKDMEVRECEPGLGKFYDHNMFGMKFRWDEFKVQGKTYLRLGVAEEGHSSFDADISPDLLALAVKEAFDKNPQTDTRIIPEILPLVMLDRTWPLLLSAGNNSSITLKCGCFASLSPPGVPEVIGMVLCMLARDIGCSVNTSFTAGSWTTGSENRDVVKLLATLKGLSRVSQQDVIDEQTLQIVAQNVGDEIDITLSIAQGNTKRHSIEWDPPTHLVPRMKKLKINVCRRCDKVIHDT